MTAIDHRVRLGAIVEDALRRFHAAIAAAGLEVSEGAIEVELRPAPHRPPTAIPAGKMAVYAFFLDGVCLKCGKVGPKSKARYASQHYNPGSAPSTLAASLLADGRIVPPAAATKKAVSLWMQANLDRVNLLVPAKFGGNVLSFLEAFLHLCWNPRFEGHQ